MKKILLFSLLIANFTFAAEDCPPAAEVAEAQNPNAYKDCDYSEKGLNGVLHRALKKKTDAAEQTESSAKPVEAIVKEDQVVAKNFLAKGEFNSAQQLQNLRFGLIQKAADNCPKGFLLESEKYLPQADKSMKLELLYHCL
jgi:hypothetical protein